MTPEQCLERVREERLVMVLRGRSGRDALAAAGAALEAGVRVVEVTFTVPGAPEVIAELVRACGDDGTVIGAGTVRTAAQMDAAVSSGAQFVVSPGLDRWLLDKAAGDGVLAMPGVLTPTEVMTALSYGARVLKLFPASAVGPGYLRALLGPMPELDVVPSGGIGPDDARQWLEAGAVALGMAGAMAPSGPMDTAALASVHEAAVRSLAAVDRPTSPPRSTSSKEHA